MRLSKTKQIASAALQSCAELKQLHTLEIRNFTALEEKFLADLDHLTALQHLALVAEDNSKAMLGALSMHLLPACTANLTYLELGKLESTYPLAALRGLSQLKFLSLLNCKPFLKPDATGHDLLVEVAHLTHLTGLALRHFTPRSLQSSQMLQDMRQLKGLKCLHIAQGHARSFFQGLSALTSLVELVLLDPLSEINSRHILNEALLGFIHLSRLELSVSGDLLVEGFRLFRHLPFLQRLKFEGCHSCDTKGVSSLFWGLTGMTGNLTSLSLSGAQFLHAVPGRYRTAAGACVHDLDLGQFPVHSFDSFANVFPAVRSLKVVLARLQPLPLHAWTNLTHLYICWQSLEVQPDPGSPLALCESLASMHALRQLTIEWSCLKDVGKRMSADDPFLVIANKHDDMLRTLPGVDVTIILRAADPDVKIIAS